MFAGKKTSKKTGTSVKCELTTAIIIKYVQCVTNAKNHRLYHNFNPLEKAYIHQVNVQPEDATTYNL